MHSGETLIAGYNSIVYLFLIKAVHKTRPQIEGRVGVYFGQGGGEGSSDVNIRTPELQTTEECSYYFLFHCLTELSTFRQSVLHLDNHLPMEHRS